MVKFLIDANLPFRFSFWNDNLYLQQAELGDSWTDSEIWDYAKRNNLTIVTKDSDFSDRIMMSDPPPRVIHIKLGKTHMFKFFDKHWDTVSDLAENHKLVNVYIDQITVIE